MEPGEATAGHLSPHAIAEKALSARNALLLPTGRRVVDQQPGLTLVSHGTAGVDGG
jgi:hypothetical protein